MVLYKKSPVEITPVNTMLHIPNWSTCIVVHLGCSTRSCQKKLATDSVIFNACQTNNFVGACYVSRPFNLTGMVISVFTDSTWADFTFRCPRCSPHHQSHYSHLTTMQRIYAFVARNNNLWRFFFSFHGKSSPCHV